MPELSGVAVLLTRRPEDNASLARVLAARGAEVVELPCVRVEPVAAEALATAVRALTPRDWLVVTSRHGVDAVLRAVATSEIRARTAAVGEGTARRLVEEAGLHPFVPSEPNGAALGRELPLEGGAVLLARADRASNDLPEGLRARGAVVAEIVAYRTVAGAYGDVPAVRRRLRSGRIDVVVFASPSAVDGLCDAMPTDTLRHRRIVAIGPSTATRVRERIGVEPRLAGDPSEGGLLRVIQRCAREAGYVAVE